MNNNNEKINKEDIFKQFEDSFDEQTSNNDHVNVLITGKSGTGKSTLINAMFGYKVARVGTGVPVTQKTTLYESKDSAIRIYDTKGLEINKYQETVNEIEYLIQEKNGHTDIDEMIGVIWYTIASNGERIEPSEIEFLNELKNLDVPVVIVLTKADNELEFIPLRETIEKLVKSDAIINVLAKSTNIYNQNGEKIDEIKVYGLSELADLTYNLLPDLQKLAFANQQKVNHELKIKQAEINKKRSVNAMTAFVAATFAEGFVPIPLADSAVMIPTQMAMIAKITAIYNIDLSKDMILSLASGFAASEGAAYVGKLVVSNLLKSIPGAGTVVGGVISGGTGAAITAAMGLGYIQLIELSQNRNWSDSEFAKFLKDVDFRQVLNSVDPDMIKSIVKFAKKAK